MIFEIESSIDQILEYYQKCEKSKMDHRKQNLYLFFEENESDWEIINSRLVSQYMNRLVIDEQHQNEIDGIFHLKKVHRFGKWNFLTEKRAHDMKLIEKVFNDVFLMKERSNMTHFIIGTWFLYGFSEPNNWVDSLFHCKLETHFPQSNCMKSIVVTMLQGRKRVITSVDLVEESYSSSGKRLRIDNSWPENSSVNDDLETNTHQMHILKTKSWYHHLAWYPTHRSSGKIIWNYKPLFLCERLNDSEDEKLKKEYAWNNSRLTGDFYHYYECRRFTMILNPDRNNRKRCKLMMSIADSAHCSVTDHSLSSEDSIRLYRGPIKSCIPF